MNYQEIYNKIIEKAKKRVLNCYKENHHIIPKCMDGDNNKSNLVFLTAREHFICHMLLVKIYPENFKLKNAVWILVHLKSKGQERYKISARTYERLKKEYSEEKSKKQKGKNNSNFGKKWTQEQKKKASIRQKETHSHLMGENNPSKRKEVREKNKQTKLGNKNSRFCNWEIISPDNKIHIVPGGYQLVEFLKNLGFTKAMFYKKVEDYCVQKNGWKLKPIYNKLIEKQKKEGLFEKYKNVYKKEIISPQGEVTIINSDQFISYLEKYGLKPSMFYKSEAGYRIQKDGWKFKTLYK